MARSISIAALNIAMHKPHSPERYVSMMREAHSLRYLVRQGSLKCAMIGSLYTDDKENPEEGLHGELYLFIKLDPSEPWFNVETKEPASAEDVEAISIPTHLLPHLRRILLSSSRTSTSYGL